MPDIIIEGKVICTYLIDKNKSCLFLKNWSENAGTEAMLIDLITQCSDFKFKYAAYLNVTKTDSGFPAAPEY